MRGRPAELDAPFWWNEPETKGEKRTAKFYRLGMTYDSEEAKRLVDHYRNLDCPEYDDCLDHAARESWRGFSCRDCPMFNVRRYHGQQDVLADRASSSPGEADRGLVVLRGVGR